MYITYLNVMNPKVSKLRSIWNTSKCKMYMFKPKQLPNNAKQTPKFTKTMKQPYTLTLSTLAATSACHFQGNADKSHTWTLNVSSSQFFGNPALKPLATFLFFSLVLVLSCILILLYLLLI